MKNKFLSIIAVVILFTSCTKKVTYPPKQIEVHFNLTSNDAEVKQTVILGLNGDLKTIVVRGNLDYTLKTTEGFCGDFTYIVKSQVSTPIKMSVDFGAVLHYHICTLLDTTVHGVTNEIIYLPVN